MKQKHIPVVDRQSKTMAFSGLWKTHATAIVMHERVIPTRLAKTNVAKEAIVSIRTSKSGIHVKIPMIDENKS